MAPTIMITGWVDLICASVASFWISIIVILLFFMVYFAIDDLKSMWKDRQDKKKRENRTISVRVHSDEEIEAYKKSLRDNGWIQRGDSSMWSRPAKDT